MMKRIFLLLLVGLIVIQFFKPDRNESTGISENHISKGYAVPANVASILTTSCTDCHSNNTVYPWYASIQPVAWWLDHHVQEGKGELNFDEFLSYKPRKAHHKLEEVNEMVKEGEMPLESYTLVHRNAILTNEQKLVLAEWTVSTMKLIEEKYPEELKKK